MVKLTREWLYELPALPIGWCALDHFQAQDHVPVLWVIKIEIDGEPGVYVQSGHGAYDAEDEDVLSCLEQLWGVGCMEMRRRREIVGFRRNGEFIPTGHGLVVSARVVPQARRTH